MAGTFCPGSCEQLWFRIGTTGGRYTSARAAPGIRSRGRRRRYECGEDTLTELPDDLAEHVLALCRYGGAPYDRRLVEIVRVLADLNDDASHLRDGSLLIERANTVSNLLWELVLDYCKDKAR